MPRPTVLPAGRLAGRFSFVTGAASGIGAATASLLASEGARVVCADLDVAGAERIALQIRDAGGDAIAARVDITREPDWEAAIEGAVRAWGALRVLVNAAGMSHAQPIVDLDPDDWRRVMAVNVEGAMLGTKHAIRAMRVHRQPSAIVNITSASGTVAQPGASAYCASKAALRMFTRVAALECRRDGLPIRINSVAPGGVRTPMWSTMAFFRDLVAEHGSEEGAYAAMAGDNPHVRFAEPDEIARTVLFLASDDASFVSGTELVVDHADV